MATTVGQHSVAAFTSPVNGTTPIDANSVRGNDNTVRSAYVDHDADPGIHVQSSTLASRPAAGTAGRKWITEDSGVYTLWFDDGTNWHPVSSENINLTVLATETLVKGDVVKVTGWNNGQDLPEVAKVASTSDVAFAIITANVANGAMGYATNTGVIQDVATNAFSVGSILYPNGSGWFTATKPTSGNYQPAAFVLRSNANNGVLYVEFSAPRIVERSDNTASTIVLRDASGNFSAGTITAGAVTSTGLVTFASLKGTGATTVTNILDEDNMASDSATALATQQSIKAYVDSKVATVDTLAEVLANGNTTGANDIIVNSGQKIRTPLVAAQDGTSAITIANTTGALTLATALADSNLATISTAGKVANSATTATSANTASAIVARDASGNFTAGTITAALTGNASTATTLQTARNINGVSFNGSADITVTAAAGTLTGTTLASGVTASSLTSVGTLTSLTVSGATNVATASAATKIGLGTTTPDASFKVTISGNSGTTTPGIFFDDQAASPKNYVLYTNGSKNFVLRNHTDALNIFEATPAGNVAFDTNTLYVDATNNRVGVGTTSPSAPLNVQVTSGTSAFVHLTNTATANNTSMRFGTDGNTSFINATGSTTGAFALKVFGSDALNIDASGNLAVDTNTLYVDAANNRVGVGTASPSDVLEVRFGTNGYITASNSTDTNTGIKVGNTGRIYGIFADGGSGASNSLRFFDFTASAERMRLDTSGNLGLGVTPSAWVTTTTSRGIQFGRTGALFYSTDNATASYGNNYYQDGASTFKFLGNGYALRYVQGDFGGEHVWQTSSVSNSSGAGAAITFQSRMTLDASGRLLVGQSSTVASSINNTTIELSSAGTGAGQPNIYVNSYVAAGNAINTGYLTFNRSGSGTLGTNTLVANNDRIGMLRFSGANGTSFTPAAEIYVEVDGTPGASNDMPGRIVFATTADGAGGTTERARITSGGYFKASNDGTYFGSTGTYHERSQSAADWISIERNTSASNPYGLFINYTGATPNGTGNEFLYCRDGGLTLRASIRSNGGLANYSANDVNLSDERVKTDIQPAPSYWDTLKAIEIVTFKYKDQTHDDVNVGVIAQQIEQVNPVWVDTDGFGETPEGEEPLKAVYGEDIKYAAIKALQEAMARIEALEARLEALEA